MEKCSPQVLQKVALEVSEVILQILSFNTEKTSRLSNFQLDLLALVKQLQVAVAVQVVGYWSVE